MKGTILFTSEIYRWKQVVGILISNLFHEECQGEGEQFPLPLEYTDRNKPSVYQYIICSMKNAREKGTISFTSGIYRLEKIIGIPVCNEQTVGILASSIVIFYVDFIVIIIFIDLCLSVRA